MRVRACFSPPASDYTFGQILRRLIVQAAVWPLPIIILSPFFYNGSRILKAGETVLVQALIPESRVKALDVGILYRFARSDES